MFYTFFINILAVNYLLICKACLGFWDRGYWYISLSDIRKYLGF